MNSGFYGASWNGYRLTLRRSAALSVREATIGGREEIDALVTVMDPVKDTYQMQPLTDDQKAEIEIDGQ